MEKTLDLRKTVSALVEEYPELKDTLADIGFADIAKPGMLKFAGKIMTIPKGAAMKHLNLGEVVERLTAAGYNVISEDTSAEPPKQGAAEVPTDRTAQLKGYITRLSEGEDMESVRKDFVENFESVSVHEIAEAEQQLIMDGMPMKEVQRLCDVHSALFHGMTDAEAAANERIRAKKEDPLPVGHPIDILHRENVALEKLLDEIEPQLDAADAETVLTLTEPLTGLACHYDKKEDTLIAILYDHGVTGPSQVMWGVDDEIIHALRDLRNGLTDGNLTERLPELKAVLTRVREMLYKEEYILFPLCRETMSTLEWYRIDRDFPEIGYTWIEEIPVWQEAADWAKEDAEQFEEEAVLDLSIPFPTGTVTLRQLRGILKLLPIDITFIDQNDILRFFTNEGKVFSRPRCVLGRPLYGCHPPEVIPMVRGMLAAFKAHEKDHMEFWTPKPDGKIRVQYFAVYDTDDSYIGTVELVEKFPNNSPIFDQN